MYKHIGYYDSNKYLNSQVKHGGVAQNTRIACQIFKHFDLEEILNFGAFKGCSPYVENRGFFPIIWPFTLLIFERALALIEIQQTEGPGLPNDLAKLISQPLFLTIASI